MKTVLGPICDDLGQAKRQYLTNDLWHPIRVESWALPAGEYRRVQPERIPVTIGHDPEPVAGQVVHMERSAGRLWVVAHLHDWVNEPEEPTYLSAEASHLDGTDVELLSVGLTPRPCQIGARPLQWFAGALDYRSVARERWHVDGLAGALLTRAASSYLDRRAGDPIYVHTATRERDLYERSHPVEIAQALEDQAWDRKPPGPLRMSRPHRGVIAVR